MSLLISTATALGWLNPAFVPTPSAYDPAPLPATVTMSASYMGTRDIDTSTNISMQKEIEKTTKIMKRPGRIRLLLCQHKNKPGNNNKCVLLLQSRAAGPDTKERGQGIWTDKLAVGQ